MSTHFEKEIDQNSKAWYLFDASGKTLGRLASEIARVLTGKHKVTYAPHHDTGDFVVVVNAEKVALTGKKLTDKIYKRYTGFIGGVKANSARDLLQSKPEYLIEEAVWGMLNKTPLGRQQHGKLKVYRGTEHPHGAQKPVTWATPKKTVRLKQKTA